MSLLLLKKFAQNALRRVLRAQRYNAGEGLIARERLSKRSLDVHLCSSPVPPLEVAANMVRTMSVSLIPACPQTLDALAHLALRLETEPLRDWPVCLLRFRELDFRPECLV